MAQTLVSVGFITCHTSLMTEKMAEMKVYEGYLDNTSHSYSFPRNVSIIR